MSRPNIYRFTHYRSFLHDYVEKRKRERTGWSYKVWAEHLGLKSSSTLIMLANGQRHPGPALVLKLGRYFGFNPEESEYFRHLVVLEKSKKDVGKSIVAMKALEQAHPDQTFRLIEQDSFASISNWYYYAIRELVSLKGFREDPAWIASQLCFPVSEAEIAAAIEALLRLGLLARNRKSNLITSEGMVHTGHDLASEGLKRFHEQTLVNAAISLRQTSPAQREISGGSFAIRRERLTEAKALIRKFQLDLCRMLDERNADSVYHLEVAFFPLTKAKPSSPSEKS